MLSNRSKNMKMLLSLEAKHQQQFGVHCRVYTHVCTCVCAHTPYWIFKSMASALCTGSLTCLFCCPVFGGLTHVQYITKSVKLFVIPVLFSG